MKKIKNKALRWTLTVLAIPFVVVLIGAGVWLWCYIGLPAFPDKKDYQTIEERADAALAFARKHNLNTRYALFVDYSVPSGTPRLYVWDFQKKKIKARTYVMHGPGKGSTAEKPVFSNIPGSNCSSLGRFKVTKFHGTHLKYSYRLKGMDIDNQTAFARGLMIHSSGWVDSHCWMKYIPLHPASCQGCVTVSNIGLAYIMNIINSENKPLLLWNYCSGRK